MGLPATQKAIVGTEHQTVRLSHHIPVPAVQPNSVVVHTAAVALNPVDAKVAFSNFCSPEAVSGCDFAGTVVAIGADVKKPLKIGDRVCGAVQGMNPNSAGSGAFAEYVAAEGDILLKIPDGMSFEDASTFGTAVGTCGMALFWSLGLPAIKESPVMARPERAEYVLVNGGSSASGTMCIQLILLAGLRPIATCSAANFDLTKRYGAEQVFDYHSETCSEDIKRYTKNTLAYAVDCITTAATMELCFKAIGRAGGKYTSLDPFPKRLATRKAVKTDWVLGPALLGKEIGWPSPYDWQPNAELRAWAESWFTSAQKLLDQGKLIHHPTDIKNGGLEMVMDGLRMLQQRAVSGKKLVYTLSH